MDKGDYIWFDIQLTTGVKKSQVPKLDIGIEQILLNSDLTDTTQSALKAELNERVRTENIPAYILVLKEQPHKKGEVKPYH